MEVFTLAALAALVVKATGVVKYVRDGNWRDAGTQAAAWVIGAALALLASGANAMEHIDVNGTPLGQLDTASAVLLGFALASAGGLVHDYTKARATPATLVVNRPLRAERND